MPKFLLFCCFFSLFLSCNKKTNAVVAPIPPASNLPTYQLVWADEFDYTGLPNPQIWGYDVGGHGWGNQELQYYTENRAENARVEDGKLIIEARKELFQGSNYSSARLVTRGKKDLLFNRIEVRAKLPKGVGTWPAIWTLGNNIGTAGWPDCGEIDIMEHVGYNQDVIHASVHTKAYYHSIGTQKTNTKRAQGVSEGFHTYRLDWTSTNIDVFIDDEKYFSFAKESSDNKVWPFDKPNYLLLNIAVGGAWGGQKGIDDTIFPQRMEIDWVRVYAPK